MEKSVHLELTKDEALVLFDFLQRFDDEDVLNIHDQSEERALWNLHAMFEKQLVEIFDPAYKKLLLDARDRLRYPVE